MKGDTRTVDHSSFEILCEDLPWHVARFSEVPWNLTGLHVPWISLFKGSGKAQNVLRRCNSRFGPG